MIVPVVKSADGRFLLHAFPSELTITDLQCNKEFVRFPITKEFQDFFQQNTNLYLVSYDTKWRFRIQKVDGRLVELKPKLNYFANLIGRWFRSVLRKYKARQVGKSVYVCTKAGVDEFLLAVNNLQRLLENHLNERIRKSKGDRKEKYLTLKRFFEENWPRMKPKIWIFRIANLQ
ncbi:MAG: hypothetical protein DRO07_01590 [Candidatus Iainarchaeum archaeon]|uniref:Uncharacterized protein n=1 Tax=Candidatus Iainarchaeum sp. TaxID=3101447 RepID=A0A497JGW4_9ARCH|nr:MAG: hypothetical protein DRO07_01590 [Candidatus Diapherotrites archaeon]